MSQKVPYWESAPLLWDTVIIGGLKMPGIARVSGGIGRKINTQAIPGDESGGTQTDLGYDGGRATITLKFWTQEHLDTFGLFADKYRPKKDEEKPAPLDVIHPALAVVGMRSLTLEKLGLPEPTSSPGVYEAVLDFLEFIPEIKAGQGEANLLANAGSTDITDLGFAGQEQIQGTGADAPGPSATPPEPIGPPAPKAETPTPILPPLVPPFGGL